MSFDGILMNHAKPVEGCVLSKLHILDDSYEIKDTTLLCNLIKFYFFYRIVFIIFCRGRL